MSMPSFHQAKHLARHPAHVQRLAIYNPLKRVQRAHNARDGAEAMNPGVRRFRLVRSGEDGRIGFADRLLAEIHAYQVVLKKIVVEHVFSRFAEIDYPLSHVGHPDAKRHALGIKGAGGMIVSADAADAETIMP